MNSVAVHEAGHAIMALHLGKQVEYINMNPKNKNSNVVGDGAAGITQVMPAIEKTLNDAKILLAGAIATVLFSNTKTVQELLSLNDDEIIYMINEEFGVSKDFFETLEILKEIGYQDNMAKIVRETIVCMDCYKIRNNIELLANKLQTTNYITGIEIEQLIQNYH